MATFQRINKISIISRYLLSRQNFKGISRQQWLDNQIYAKIFDDYTVPSDNTQSVDFGFVVFTSNCNKLQEALESLASRQ
jgi:hypothetical protein